MRPTPPTTVTRAPWSASDPAFLQQNGLTELEATLFKDGLVRAPTPLPLVLPVAGAQNLPRGARVRVRLGEPDLISLDIHGTVVERLDAARSPGGRKVPTGRTKPRLARWRLPWTWTSEPDWQR